MLAPHAAGSMQQQCSSSSRSLRRRGTGGGGPALLLRGPRPLHHPHHPQHAAASLPGGMEGPEGAPSLLPVGTRVRVKSQIKVFHVPKQGAGIELQGLEGEVVKNAALWKDKVLSPNLPYIVQLSTGSSGDGVRGVSFKAHLVGGGRGGWLAGWLLGVPYVVLQRAGER